MLTDYVGGSAATYVRNPNYYQTDPVGLGKGNQLPYLDGIKHLIVLDPSTRLAAFRTGKVDYVQAISLDDYRLLSEQHPELEYNTIYGQVRNLVCRVDKPELPFDDLRVRHAINLAINQQEILDDYFNGKGVLIGYPYLPSKGYEKFYTPMEEMPEEVKMLFTYDPEKAKELLTEAGYPNGFATKIQCSSSAADEVSILKAYLADVGIDMQIETMEGGA